MLARRRATLHYCCEWRLSLSLMQRVVNMRNKQARHPLQSIQVQDIRLGTWFDEYALVTVDGSLCMKWRGKTHRI